MKEILTFLDSRSAIPVPLGAMHLFFCALVIILTVFLCKKFGNCSEKTFKRILLIAWITIIVFEIYKQIILPFSITDGKITLGFQWYIFPFQFCSTPFYTLPVLIFSKNKRLREFVLIFVSTFSLFAGIAVYATPFTVFCDIIGINIQTMVHHGSQIVIGIFAAYRSRRLFTLKNYPGALAVFGAFCSIALILDELYYWLISKTVTFNMFFISRHFPCALPVLDVVWEKVPYPLFLAIYILGFSAIGFIFLALESVIFGNITVIKKQAK